MTDAAWASPGERIPPPPQRSSGGRSPHGGYAPGDVGDGLLPRLGVLSGAGSVSAMCGGLWVASQANSPMRTA